MLSKRLKAISSLIDNQNIIDIGCDHALLDISYITEVFENLSSIISLLNIIMFFVTFILVISTGVIIVFGK